jgi:hypothetical protein
MGARPEQQLALNFLAAIHDLWIQHPGRYIVAERADDLVAALAQMCIKALAADIRDDSSVAGKHDVRIIGRLANDGHILKGVGSAQPLTLDDVLNKIIHGTPTSVVVQDGAIQLHFQNSAADRWTEAWFSGTQLLQELGNMLHKHQTDTAKTREREIAEFLEDLGIERFLPTRT